VRLLQRARRLPLAKTIRPTEPYLAAAAQEARQLGHEYIGTEHVLSVLIHSTDSAAVQGLGRLGISVGEVEAALARWLSPMPRSAKIDAQALAELGIDFEVVRERLEESFGPGALERTSSACLGVCPRLKLALAYALDHAAGGPLGDEHVLLGILSVPDSVGARVLGELGVTLEAAQAML
jgi:ATP-dependent Clp protease ATP-binding subunit ClpA